MCPALWVFCMERQLTTLGPQDELDTASNDIQSTGEKRIKKVLRISWTFWNSLRFFELFWIILNTSELRSISPAWRELVRSNPAREWSVTQAWADRCLDEFFAQGDQDRRRAQAKHCQTHLWSSLHISHLHILHKSVSFFINLYHAISIWIYVFPRFFQLFLHGVVVTWCRTILEEKAQGLPVQFLNDRERCPWHVQILVQASQTSFVALFWFNNGDQWRSIM